MLSTSNMPFPSTSFGMFANYDAGLVEFLPMWLAPNLITLMASACIAVAYAVNVVYLPDFTGRSQYPLCLQIAFFHCP
jgi:hypothetical protein